MYSLFPAFPAPHAIRRPASIRYHRLYDTVAETGSPHFLHGVSITPWQSRLCACFAYNDRDENSITEQLLIRWSDDDGHTWTPAQSILPSAPWANSHSVFLPQEDLLWCFGPRFLGLGQPPITSKGHQSIHFVDLQMEAWTFDGCTWHSVGIVASDFWPLSAPTPLSNGSWMIAGCNGQWSAALALSHGSDLSHWDVISPDTQGEIFTEASAWANGSDVLMVMRNQSVLTDGKFHAAAALSHDHGRTFSPCFLTDLPMATTKPFCGRLSDGRPYLVFNESIPDSPYSRARLLLAIGAEHPFSLSHVYLVDEGLPAARGDRLALSYPYACQIGQRLYITYSYESAPGTGFNHNDAMLAVVDLSCLS